MKLEKCLGGFAAYVDNGVYVGDILLGEDGYYVWFPVESNGGFIDQGFLLDMYNTLVQLNMEWDKQVQNDLSIGHREHNLE